MPQTEPHYFTEFKNLVIQKFNQIDQRFNDVAESFSDVNTRFDEIDSRFIRIDTRFAGIEERLDEFNLRLKSSDQRFQNIELGMRNFQDTLDSVEYDVHLLKNTCATKDDIKPIYEYLGRNELRVAKLEETVVNDHRPRITRLENELIAKKA